MLAVASVAAEELFAGTLGLLGAVGHAFDWVRWPLVVSVAIAFVSIWVSYFSGEALTEANQYGGPIAELVETHEARAGILRIAITVLAVLAVAAAWLHAKPGTVRTVLVALVPVAAVFTAVYTVLTGDAGAQIAWYGTNG